MADVASALPIAYSRSRPVRTTVAISHDVLEAADEAVRSGAVASRNDLLDRALRTELWRLENEAIDAQIAASRDDPELDALELELVAEAEVSGWEALLIGEADLEDQS